jgi:pilus assembly protein FimV
LLSSKLWALGLGEIKLDSALNEPLRAEIELLSATTEELAGLKVAMASAETFGRYGLDRPVYLQNIQFQIRHSGRADGNVVEIRSQNPVTEPFITFLVEASWARGRLLREYTLLLDPPTFAPAATAQPTPAVSAPTRSTPADSGRIERPAPAAATSAPQPEPARTSPPRVAPQAVPDDRPYDATAGESYEVARSETLWGIASRTRPDSRLTMNQTMLAIFEANPQAFGGNINILRAGASLRIPSADEIYRIGRTDALNEVQRQHAAWNPGYRPAPVPSVAETTPQNDLTLVPPDDDYLSDTVTDDVDADAGEEELSREQEIERRIFDLENADVPVQRSLIEIRDNELAALREELAQIRGEAYEPELDDPFVDDTGDEPAAELDADAAVGDEVVEATPEPAPAVQRARPSKPGLVEQILDVLSSWWIPIVGVLVVVGGLLLWFIRRGGDDHEPETWRSLDADDVRGGDLSATESMRAPKIEDSFMVVEQPSGIRDVDATMDSPAPRFSQTASFDAADNDAADETGQFDSLEDTFSSETAINLDQSDPIAEADFHMAYGLYDQAADLINGALSSEPNRPDLLSKLCEIYFVWGNRDAFIDAAGRLKSVVSSDGNPEWDKIVIMGRQIAADAEMFAGAGVAAATRAVDMSFESDSEGTGALDMEFGADSGDGDIVDLGGYAAETAGDEVDGLDFAFTDADEASEPVRTDYDLTAETPTQESTMESPTIEQQFDGLTGSLASDATAEINLDDLDLGGLEETEIASLDELDATGELPSLDDPAEVTGKNPEVDPDATGLRVALGDDDTGINESIDIDSTYSGSGVDESLLDATGSTQVLPDDYVVSTMSDIERELGDADATMLAPGYGDDDTEVAIGDDQATMLASLDDDDDNADFDFAKTEALPPSAFTGNSSLDETGELPAIATTDFDLDLDDLTAALQVSEIGDTIEQKRDDATVQQRRPDLRGNEDDGSPTIVLEPGEMSDDLHDARTMTEVGTKLDLARAYVDMGDPSGARSILEEVLDEGDAAQRQQAQQLLDSLPS